MVNPLLGDLAVHFNHIDQADVTAAVMGVVPSSLSYRFDTSNEDAVIADRIGRKERRQSANRNGGACFPVSPLYCRCGTPPECT